MFIVGISGLGGSGKNTVATALRGALGRGEIVDLGELVRHDFRPIDSSVNRGICRLVGNHRRRTLGGDYWLRKAIALKSDADTLILVGLYAVSEVMALKARGGFLVWVDAPERERLQRIVNRQDGPRDEMARSSPELFAKYLNAEVDGAGEATISEVCLQQIQPIADFVLENNGGVDDIEALCRSIVQRMGCEAPAILSENLRAVAAAPEERVELTVPVDTYDRLFDLERLAFFEHFLASQSSRLPGVHDKLEPGLSLKEAVKVLYRPNLRGVAENQSARRMAEIFALEDPLIALARLRQVSASSPSEEYFVSLEDREFFDVHLEGRVRWEAAQDTLPQAIKERLLSFKKYDRMQFEQKNTNRSLEFLREHGLSCSLKAGSEYIVQQIAAGSEAAFRPLLESLNNHKKLEVGGFEYAKASLVIHDIIDHLWTFDLLDRCQIFERYRSLFDALGLGLSCMTDIFKREGEIIASISYGVRAFRGALPGFRSTFSFEDIVRILSQADGGIVGSTKETFRIMSGLSSSSTEAISLAFVYSNYITELDEQRRRFGGIKFRDPKSGQVKGELSPMSLDFLCLFIEVHHQLLRSVNKHRDALFSMHYLLEEYLRSIATGTAPKSIHVTPSLLNGDSLRYGELVPPKVSEWMYRNYGFTANRNTV